MDLEIHQLDLRYESLRVLNPRGERKLLASIGDTEQLVPISVVEDDELSHDEPQRYVVLDGFARVRVLRRLGRDTIAKDQKEGTTEQTSPPGAPEARTMPAAGYRKRFSRRSDAAHTERGPSPIRR